MKKSGLIELLHLAQQNYDVLMGFYSNAVKYNEQKSVEAVPVVHGEWKHKSHAFVCCSECGNIIERLRRTNFCPNCGADMRKKV